MNIKIDCPVHERSEMHHQQRRGVVLLVVVSLLALFVLLGVTYTLAVSQYHQASKLELQVDRLGDRPDSETDIVLGQILYDTQARTTLQYHSLLRDLYGYDANIVSNVGAIPQYRESLQGTVSAITGTATNNSGTVAPFVNGPTAYTGPGGAAATNTQFYTFQFILPIPNPVPATLTALSPVPNYYAGRVITFQGPGPTANHSSRIVAYNPIQPLPDTSTTPPTPAYGQFTIEMIESKLAGTVTPAVNDQFVVNGAPFNGTGSGYYVNSANLTGDANNFGINNSYAAPDPTTPGSYLTPFPVSLLPNIGAYDTTLGSLLNNLNPVDFGGLDEGWDAPDLQNLFLAMVPPRAAESRLNNDLTNVTTLQDDLPIIPSFHRPELVNFWVNNMPTSDALRSRLNVANVGSIGSPTTLSAAEKDFLRTIIFRPMPWDHPNFTGTNPNFAGTNTVQQLLLNLTGRNASLYVADPWDVDNDGDGIPDSIWIDPGLPVITTPEGRRYKRLAAILIKDLDGSLNINAHGNLAQVANAHHRAETQTALGMLVPASGTYTAPPNSVLGLVPQGYYLPRGMGYGPAEVDFLQMLTGMSPASTDTNAVQSYTNLMRMRYSSKVTSAGPTFDDGSTASPGKASPTSASAIPYDYRDPLAAIKHPGLPNDYANLNSASGITFAQWITQPSWYASPPDVWGRSAVVLDAGGQPLFAFAGQGPPAGFTTGEAADSPYEICLSGENNNADTPYTVAELERLLRYHDVDSAQLSPRLLNAATGGGLNPLATGYPNNYPVPYYSPVSAPNGSEPPGIIGPSHHRRNMLTTLSSHLPVPETAIPPEFRSIVAANVGRVSGSASILDLYYARLVAGLCPPAQYAVEMQKIVPWEFFKGQKFDINRQFGDGVDSNGDFVRDDPYEAAGEYAWQGGSGSNSLPNLPDSFKSTVASPVYAQHTNATSVVGGGPGLPYNPTVPQDNLHARQLYARHLFCMAMLFLPPNLITPANVSSFPPATFPNDQGITSQQKYQALIIRRIAQWAINCVDYRDHDSVMTPFEFDYNPWNGWQVDGNLNTDGVNVPEQILINGSFVATSTTDRGVVWGMEAPEVVVSETMAFHDRGLKDTAQAGPSDTKVPPAPSATDMDLDQFRVPKGSLFVELYCPRPTKWNTTANQPVNTKPLNNNGTDPTFAHSVNLAQLAPTDAAGFRRPVWRLAISRLTKNDANNPSTQVYDPQASNFVSPESMSAEQITYNGAQWTANMSLVPGNSVPLTIDRFAYFADADGTTNGGVNVIPAAEMSSAFWSKTGGATFSLPLLPGQYGVVAPRPLTYIGSQNPTNATPTPPAGSLWGGNSKQYIQALTNSVTVTDTTGTLTSRTAGTDMRQPLGIVCEAPNPLYPTGDTDLWNAGLNISEPMPALATSTSAFAPSGIYYPSGPGITFKPPGAPKLSAGPDPRAANADFYDDPDVPTQLFKTTPLEASNTNYPINRAAMLKSGTYTDCSSVLLQRLANPNLPYNPPQYDSNGVLDANYNASTMDALGNPVVNPYITVDWQTLDLTVFNGEEDMKNSDFTEIYYNKAVQALGFRSRQRGFLSGGATIINGTTMTANPWPPLTRNDPNVAGWETPILSGTGGSPTYFDAKLSNNLTAASNAASYTFDIANNIQSFGSLNCTVDHPLSTAIATTPYFGEPNFPFPWINWNNRPFTNFTELLSVPASSPGRFFLEMTPGFPPPLTAPPAPPAAPTISPYTDALAAGAASLHLPFGQMLNFFQSASYNPANLPSTWTTTSGTAQLNGAPHLYRLLDFVEVPSPYSGAERWYNPQHFGTYNSGTGQFGGVAGYYRPPFNKLSRFRDPGRVNANTIFDSEIWDSIVAQFPGMRNVDGFANQMFVSRQGDYNTSGSTASSTFYTYGMSPNYPTRFGNPFRPSDSADLMPVFATPTLTPTMTGNPAMRRLNPVESTFVRPDPSTYAGSKPLPLFQINPTVGTYTNPQYSNWVGNPPGAVGGTLTGQHHDVTRNPYFANQAFQKLGNILTNHSNCFAVWITIGYFEVEDNASTPKVDAAHPDGFSLAQEVGADSGQVTRHRAFYIIDRSVPVGFIPGSKLNTDDCILVRRLIE